MKIPEITEISRLTIKPGDRLIVRAATDLTPDQADYIKQRIKATLRIPDDIPVVVVPHSLELQVTAEET